MPRSAWLGLALLAVLMVTGKCAAAVVVRGWAWMRAASTCLRAIGSPAGVFSVYRAATTVEREKLGVGEKG